MDTDIEDYAAIDLPSSGSNIDLLPDAAEIEKKRIARRRAAALALIAQSQQPVQGQMMQGGAGPLGQLPDIYIAPSAFDHLGNMADAAIGGLSEVQADKDELAVQQRLDQASQAERNRVLALPEDQRMAGLMQSSDPELRKAGLLMAVQKPRVDAIAAKTKAEQEAKAADQAEAARLKRVAGYNKDIEEGEKQFERGMSDARERIRERKRDEEVRANRLADRQPPADQLVYDAQGNAVWANPRNHTVTPVATGPTGAPAIQKPLGEQEKKQQAAIVNYESTLQNYKNLLADYDPQGRDAASLAKRKAIDSAYSQLLLQGKELANLGALTGPDVGLMEQLVTNPTNLRGSIEGAAFGRTGFNEQVKQAEGVVSRTKQNFETQHGRKIPAAASAAAPQYRLIPGRNPKLKSSYEVVK